MLIRPDAERDVAEAYQWYEEQRMGLGSDFIVCFEEGLAKIQRSPAAYPIVYKKVHRVS